MIWILIYYSDYRHALVFCTPELNDFHKHIVERGTPNAMPQDQMQYCRVRDLLMAPASSGPTKILVSSFFFIVVIPCLMGNEIMNVLLKNMFV